MYGPEKQSYLLSVQLSILGDTTNNKRGKGGLEEIKGLLIFSTKKGGGTCLR